MGFAVPAIPAENGSFDLIGSDAGWRL